MMNKKLFDIFHMEYYEIPFLLSRILIVSNIIAIENIMFNNDIEQMYNELIELKLSLSELPLSEGEIIQ